VAADAASDYGGWHVVVGVGEGGEHSRRIPASQLVDQTEQRGVLHHIGGELGDPLLHRLMRAAIAILVDWLSMVIDSGKDSGMRLFALILTIALLPPAQVAHTTVASTPTTCSSILLSPSTCHCLHWANARTHFTLCLHALHPIGLVGTVRIRGPYPPFLRFGAGGTSFTLPVIATVATGADFVESHLEVGDPLNALLLWEGSGGCCHPLKHGIAFDGFTTDKRKWYLSPGP
jgi:hypothetical protein